MGMGIHIIIMIVLSVATFATVLLVLFQVFGAPTCTSLAEQTALQLKYAIDDVSKDSFPIYTGSDVPLDPTYYKAVPIRLCQEYGEYSYWLQFFGGFPQYQVYYEMFPETGFVPGSQHLWNEAYPWSGGAASSFAFWGAMRIGTAFVKYVSLAMEYDTWKIALIIHRVRTKAQVIREWNYIRKTIDHALTLDEFLKKRGEYLEYLNTHDANLFGIMIKKGDTESLFTAQGDAGLLLVNNKGEVLFDGDTGKSILSDDFMEMKARIQEPTGVFERQIYIKRDAGKVTDMKVDDGTGIIPTGFEVWKVKPSEEFKKYANELERLGLKKQADLFKEVYAFPDDVPSPLRMTLKELPKGVEGTAWYKTIDKSFWKKIQRTFQELKEAGYNLEATTLTPVEALALGEALKEMAENPEFLELILKTDIGIRTKVQNAIMKKSGLASPEDIRKIHITDFIGTLSDNAGFTASLHKDSTLNIWRMVANKFKESVFFEDPFKYDNTFDLPIYQLWRARLVSGLGEEQVNKFEIELGEMGIVKIIHKARESITPEEFADPSLIRQNPFPYEKRIFKEYFMDMMEKLKSNDPDVVEKAIKEQGIIIGFLEQNTDTLPISVGMKGIRREVRRLVVIRGSAFVTPTSWIYKGILATQITEGCLGNSICLYDHAAESPESPYYLDESADKFDVRVWRPVNPLYHFAGVEAMMMWVSEHPRFYVVSPCFAIAKIWKTNYIGIDTIFVKPEKVDMKGEASNYCYADEELINQYTAIWFASDVWNIIESYFTAGTATGVKLLIKSIIKYGDPSNLVEILAEMAVSWPGYPYKSMNYDTMQSEAGQTAFNDLLRQLKKDGFDY